ncbi:uncharacterized protein LOC124633156 [Helicoverpa zea]|uniref:uncharacterized protein LOC124633156 n=1 Tax=Helicoverpa zea TaxID=7113 RepID=UPI001F58148A|nr:uncharacterized protein LOC124633156 [Helicoverpa zea]
MCYFQCVKYYLIITAIISFTIVYFVRKRILSATMSLCNRDELSDDEVFFGKLTLKELKKHILWDKQQQTIHAASATNSPINSDDHNASLKILQAHSQPNLLPNREISNLDISELNNSSFDKKAADDSFIKMENMVAKLCMSPKKNEKAEEELNNTLEVIEYILNNPPAKVDRPLVKTEKDIAKSEITSDLSPQKFDKRSLKPDTNISPKPPQNTPIKAANQTPKNKEDHSTPRETKHKPIFKTPSQPLSLKKPSATSLKKTPGRSNAYQHISSPVASYIKNCPIAPLVKDVHPKKPLPGTSSIPKFVKHAPPAKPSNKENVNLPSVAYKSAKKTRVIDMPDEQKLPQCQWAKKIMSTLPRPTVMKHDHRELNLAKKKIMPQQEDSFADLSYHQAEVSVCTQKSAFKANKNF